MRILHICESYPPDYGGGAAVYAGDICRALSLRGHEVRVLTTEASAAPDYSVRSSVEDGVAIRSVTLSHFRLRDPEGWSLGFLGYRVHQMRIDTLIRAELARWHPDIVQLHTTRPFGEQQFFTIRSLRLPMVAMAHEAWLVCMRLMLLRSPQSVSCGGPSPARCFVCVYTHYDTAPAGIAKLPWRVFRQGLLPLYRLRRREVARTYPDLVLAYSRFMTHLLAKHLPRVRYVSLGVTHPTVLPPRPERPRTPFRFGFFAGGQPSKGLADVLAASGDLRQRGLALELRIWGPNGDRVRQLIGAGSAEDFALFRGTYSPEDLWAAYSEVDAAVMATRVTEPFGRIPQEAALAGIPSIVPAIGGLTEQIRDGVDGLLFEFANAKSLGLQMERLLREPLLYAQLASNLWKVRDTMEAVGEIEDAYRQVLARAATPPQTLADRRQ